MIRLLQIISAFSGSLGALGWPGMFLLFFGVVLFSALRLAARLACHLLMFLAQWVRA